MELKQKVSTTDLRILSVLDILLKGDELPSKYCNHMLEPKSERII